YQTLDLVQAMAHGRRTIDDWDLIIPVPPSFGYDWSVFAGCVNEHYDRYATTGSLLWSSPAPMAMLTIRSRSRMMADEFALSMLSTLETTREAQRRITCSERIQRITLAMLLYECDHNTLPPAYSIDADGNPLHSWRVLLLPYLGQEKLHDQIRRNEPWDSEHNRQFHEEAMAFYQCPSAKLPPGQTTYSVVVGP
ncbi:MAG: DUF1559 domain-containing protein, partial [Chloroflexi bacterium]|nr:DUF1559 domain-containing protein [Chloroflexota bacterium]